MEILVKQVTEEDEYKWQQLLSEELQNQKGRTPYSETLFYDLQEYTLPLLSWSVECRMQRWKR